MTVDAELDELLARPAARVLGVLVRRHGRGADSEDAVQQALVADASRWPTQGVPEQPLGWLVTVAERRLVDLLRRDGARRRREDRVAAEVEPGPAGSADDSLALLFSCCHPSLTQGSQLALTLRAVAGLSTAEIARAFLVPEATMARRISRAKQTIRVAGAGFDSPQGDERSARLGVVRHVLYLLFTEGCSASSGPEVHRAELADEAVRRCRMLRAEVPDDDETAGLLALVRLNRAVALGRVAGPRAGLEEVAALDEAGTLAGHHRVAAVRAHLLEQLGDREAARRQYRRAALGATATAERRHLERRAARLVDG